MLYLKKKIQKDIKKNLNNNMMLIIAVPTIYEKLVIYIYNRYIKLDKIILSQSSLPYKESYSIYKKGSKNFILINNFSPKIYIKDNLLYKIILIKYNYLNSNSLFAKSILIPRNIITQITHKQLIYTPNFLFLNLKNSINNSIKIYILYKNYIYTTLYYSYWNNLFKRNKYYFNFFKGILLFNKKNNYFTSSVKDITLGLICIETIFEAKTLPNIYLIPSKLGILNSIYLSYEETTLNYLWKYNLYACNNNTTLFFTEITTSYLQLYEHKTSIVLPNNIITVGDYSVNVLLLKIFSHNLNYYIQDQSVILSHIFIFNLMVESLLKQYFKNGVVIPSIQFELIVKKMTSFVKVNYIGNSTLIENDIFHFSKLKMLNYSLNLLGYKQLLYYPIVLGITKSVIANSGFLTSISFQEIIKYLIKLSIETSTEWLTDLKSKIITTDLIKTGSGWHRHFSKIKL